ncbi:MAG: hypothetical protein ACXVA4_04045, partial [Ktedonobacterales bacterium]
AERQKRKAWYSHAGDVRHVDIVETPIAGEWRVQGQMANRFHGTFGTKFFETEIEALEAARNHTTESLKKAQSTVRSLERHLGKTEERIWQLDEKGA